MLPEDDYPETPIEPIELPYVLNQAAGCDEGCDKVEVRSNVSPETMELRRAAMPMEEFALAQELDRPGHEVATLAALQRAAELVDAGSPDELMDVAIHLVEVFFDFERFRGVSDEQRQTLWAERVEQLVASQTTAQQFVERLGGTLLGALQLANIVYARVPARSLDLIARMEDTTGVELDGAQVPTANGLERRSALSMNNDGYQSYGWDGSNGHGSNGAAKVAFAVIESNNYLNATHLSFKDNATSSRIASTKLCAPNCIGPAFTGTADSHGTHVASILLSDFEDNQQALSPPLPANIAQPYGGIAPEGLLYYYNVTSKAGTASAINDAVSLGVDIINISLSPDNGYCDNVSHDGVMEAVRQAENTGVLVVVASGNDADVVSGCSVNGYGSYPDALTVGGTEDVTDLSSLSTVQMWNESGSNLVAQTTAIAGGYSVKTRMVELTATAFSHLVAGAGTTGTASGVGTSDAAPQVAGAAGVLKDWAYETGGYIGPWRNNPYVLRVMLAAMGDGAYSASPGSQTSVDIDERTGFGHLRFRPPSQLGTDGYPKAYWYPAAHPGDVFEIPVGGDAGAEPNTIKGWKFAALIDFDEHESSPAVLYQLIDKCPPGGGEVVVKVSQRATHKGRLRMKESEMATKYHGRCLWVRASVNASFLNNSFPLYMAQYAYTAYRFFYDM